MFFMQTYKNLILNSISIFVQSNRISHWKKIENLSIIWKFYRPIILKVESILNFILWKISSTSIDSFNTVLVCCACVNEYKPEFQYKMQNLGSVKICGSHLVMSRTEATNGLYSLFKHTLISSINQSNHAFKPHFSS